MSTWRRTVATLGVFTGLMLWGSGACTAAPDTGNCGLTSGFCDVGAPIPDAVPDSESCHFQGLDVVCVRHSPGKPDVTTTDTPPMGTNPGDQVPDYDTMANTWADKHVSAWPPAPEPGREQYLTPYEESLSDDYRPFAPLRMCADGTMWDPIKIKHCPDGNPGTVTWIHNDGTVVTVNSGSPRGIRWNGGEVR